MKNKQNFFTDNPDIAYHMSPKRMNELFAWMSDAEKEALGVSTAEEYRKMWLDIGQVVGEFSGTTLENNNQKVAKEDLKLENGEVIFPKTIKENVRVFNEMGGPGMSIRSEFGGMNAPFMVELAGFETIYRACPSTALNVCWYGSIATVIDQFGSQELKDEWIPKIATGEVSGSMSLTEPDVGSDLAGMRTYAEEQGDGTWLVNGNKQFISNGCGEISLVLAMNQKGAKGLKAINLYLVPRKVNGKNNYEIAKIEEKPGLHGSATCALKFEKSVGYLIGENGKGFHYMLHLMNEARLGVAFQALGVMEACYRLSRDYAQQREAWGKPIAKHEMIAERLYDMEVELKAFRSLCYRAAHYISLITLGDRRLEEGNLPEGKREEIISKLDYYKRKLREWTPLVKWWGGERAYVYARNAVQIHGGYGFTTEYKAEWWLRESLILSIYEGTSEIQSLMVIKDTVKDIMNNPKDFVEITVGSRVMALAEKDWLMRRYFKMRQTFNLALVSIFFKLVKTKVKSKFSADKPADLMKLLKLIGPELVKFDNLSPALLHAGRIAEMKAILAIAHSVIKDAERDESFRYAAERFVNKNGPIMAQIKAQIDMDDDYFQEQILGEKEEMAKAANSDS
ncbi:MAG TPA: acyl-CoA dehydrogenase family protein [Oligoflexus sp.]|uniref:acyl-CoA dehydrogenase family protein n=1 Tax=Oligoflexus sp. TaxID=1971216 RepID=UPI002D7F706F|nr:acyl-CoA dehydrogenase family protein [Oligoflexus sp.]HET9235815.1 acyl-CoA dehydrogenase family protein [Oligoflexus sp.]